MTWTNATDHDLLRLWKAIVLSPTIHVCQALLRGEHVPPSALDPTWVRALGRRP